MTDTMRWRYSETNPVIVPVHETNKIEIGDLVCYMNDSAFSALMFGITKHPYINSLNAASCFLGVAMQSSKLGEGSNIRVATSGVFEFDCEPNTFVLGQMVGVFAHNDKNHMIERQMVAPVTDPLLMIGKVAKREPTPSNTVLISIKSRIME